MEIIIDSREKTPFSFTWWPNITTRVGTLATGDYSIVGLEHEISIERKTITDIVNCLKGKEHQRFERELNRARGLDFFVVLIEGSISDVLNKKYRSDLLPSEAMGRLVALQLKYKTTFVWAGTRPAAENYLLITLQSYLDYYVQKSIDILERYYMVLGDDA